MGYEIGLPTAYNRSQWRPEADWRYSFSSFSPCQWKSPSQPRRDHDATKAGLSWEQEDSPMGAPSGAQRRSLPVFLPTFRSIFLSPFLPTFLPIFPSTFLSMISLTFLSTSPRDFEVSGTFCQGWLWLVSLLSLAPKKGRDWNGTRTCSYKNTLNVIRFW
jgi:hypothetical protein